MGPIDFKGCATDARNFMTLESDKMTSPLWKKALGEEETTKAEGEE